MALLLLTASTGTVDAVSYLALDRVFTGNMTGNLLFVGFGLVGLAEIPLLNNLLALAAFVTGAVIAGRVVGRGHPERSLPRRSVALLAVLLGTLAAIAVGWSLAGALRGPALLIVTGVLAAVMGMQAVAVKPVGNTDVTTIVVTSTLVNLARDSRLAGGAGEKWIPRLLAVLAMLGGAVLGAAIVALAGGAAALGAAAVLVATAVGVLVGGSRGR
ncbi:MAG: DUF1275 domain-containing protein [Actinomycetales bacterium]|nr:DUF1275 domain-containing protein [Actinomycetales bacterium]